MLYPVSLLANNHYVSFSFKYLSSLILSGYHSHCRSLPTSLSLSDDDGEHQEFITLLMQFVRATWQTAGMQTTTGTRVMEWSTYRISTFFVPELFWNVGTTLRGSSCDKYLFLLYILEIICNFRGNMCM